MRILHVSWEYPPIVYGGLGRHVYSLAQEQARQGHDVTVLTQRAAGSPAQTVASGVRVVGVEPPSTELPRDPIALVEWVAALNSAMMDAAAEVVRGCSPEIVHAHDWVVTGGANAARLAANVPLVTTIHATEAGRHQGWINGTVSTTIHQHEFVLTNQSQRVIVCSPRMREAVIRLFHVEPTAVDVVPNGIDLAEWSVPEEDAEVARERWARSERLAVFVGRLEWEKGVQTLVDALPLLRTPNVHLVIAGTGSYQSAIIEQARDLIEAEVVTITGWLPQADLRALQAAADVMVVPSRYEPFGLVALEAGALGVPVVVADTGGLTDVVDGGAAGYVFEAGNAPALAQAIDHALGDRADSAHRVARMQARLKTIYRWDTIATSTAFVYERAIAESQRDPRPTAIEPPTVPDENLLGISP